MTQTTMSDADSVAPTTPDDDVVLLDERGRPCGIASKRAVHGPRTPFHLAVSCHVVDADGRVLLTRRSSAKRTWPGVWTNACCGHPRPGESIDQAIRRHLRDELGVAPVRLELALPDFTYRATMDDGLVEHELCPVFVAEIDAQPSLDPREADALEWTTWDALQHRASESTPSLSPWSVMQLRRLGALTNDPLRWLRDRPTRAASTLPSTTSPAVASVAPPLDIDRALESFLDEAIGRVAALDPLGAELAEPIRALVLAGGKRLRPTLVRAGFSAIAAGTWTARNLANVAHLAASVEMLHTFALLHDDVMDRSTVRRGAPSAGEQFRIVHARDGGADSAWFGASAAIVAGDLAFVWADELIDRVDVDADVNRALRRVYDQLRREVITGQYMDLRLAGPRANDVQAHTVALLKSGRYTVTRPVELGATLAGADESTLVHLRRYGDAVGVAFQLRDDVFGVFGDPSVMGKAASDDIRSGKASLLIVRAIELAAPEDRLALQRLGEADLDDVAIERCRDAIRSSGALASIERLIDAKLSEARDALVTLHASRGAHVGALAELAETLGHRSA